MGSSTYVIPADYEKELTLREFPVVVPREQGTGRIGNEVADDPFGCRSRRAEKAKRLHSEPWKKGILALGNWFLANRKRLKWASIKLEV